MESCEAQLEAAAENDIPVVVLDSGVQSGLVNAVCATDNYAIGAEAANKLAEAIGGQGQVAIMTHVAASQTSRDKMCIRDRLWDVLSCVNLKYS